MQSSSTARKLVQHNAEAANSNGAAVHAVANGNGNGHGHVPNASKLALTIGAVGIVYGDIGTSPIYAFREALHAAHADGVIERAEVLGVASLILWALIIIVAIKYIIILLNADNDGEGGTLALMTLARRSAKKSAAAIFALGILAASLFYGDAIITPAISVLSAVEGLKHVTRSFEPFVILITLLIIVMLFAAQKGGTSRLAAAFGPITLVWFIALGIMGAVHLAAAPEVLLAFNPAYGISFLATHGAGPLAVLGAIFLAVTGAEALYADLGHFGRGPIRTAWFAVVMPSLCVNYLGQAALVLTNEAAAEDPFFLMTPHLLLLPLVILATLATIIASQAVITGAYSLSRQAIQLGMLPRMRVQHTSEKLAGQIYMPQINAMLLAGVIFLVLVFKSSGALASAYGIAVTGTMIITAMMTFIIVWKVWRWPLAGAIGLMAPFILIEFAFLAANSLKIAEGGWAPLALGFFIVTAMATWVRGAKILSDKTRRTEVQLQDLLTTLETSNLPHVPGTAVFLTTDPDYAPTALLHNLKHNKVLHEQNVILTVRNLDTPYVASGDCLEFQRLSEHFIRVIISCGFMETPNIPRTLTLCRKEGFKFEIMNTSFFLSHRSIKSDPKSGMPPWQDQLFIFLAQSSNKATEFFRIPTDRVVEVGTQVTV